MRVWIQTRVAAVPLAALLAALLAAGCPPPPDGGGDPQTEYDRGFMDGFEDDELYWTGYFDSWDTLGAGDNYQGDDIDIVDDPPYDSGYYDGQWYAYNDGYFVAYKYAFVIGWSEGYDTAYDDYYLDFLDEDEHVEYGNGGFADGYHDGFSEGRVFGAYDYEANIDFDWLGALLDYEDGLDLYFEEVDVGTGSYGPVDLYVHGTDPSDPGKARRKAVEGYSVPTLRKALADKVINIDELELYRPLIDEAEDELDVSPVTSLRSDIELIQTDTWLDRVLDYLDVAGKKNATADKGAAPATSQRAAGPRARVPAE